MTNTLVAWEVTHVALESTGEYWKPVYNLLEGNVTVLVVNAQHVKHVPGRKTDVQDAEWLAELLVHGLLKASFIPPKPQRDLRDLTRYRVTLVEERARVVNRVQKVLENANIKLASVATDVLGVSGRRMLEALVAGQTDAATMAELAKGRLRNKLPLLQQALTGVVDAQHRFLIAQHLLHIDFLDEQIATVSDQIVQQIEGMPPLPPPTDARTDEVSPALSWQDAADLLDTAPGVDQKAAYQVLAEVGINMRQFPTANHLAAWGGLALATGRAVENVCRLGLLMAIANCARIWCSAPGLLCAPKTLILEVSTIALRRAAARNGRLLLLLTRC